MSRKTISAFMIPFLVLGQISFAFADFGVVLSDYELDQVHAGGLNLDFDSFLGSMGTTTDSISKGSGAFSRIGDDNPFVVSSGGSKVTILTPASPKSPTSPKGPEAPASPASPVVPESPVNPVVPVSPGDPSFPDGPVSPFAASVPVSPSAPAGPGSPVDPVSPNTPVQPVTPGAPFSPDVASIPATPASPAVPSSPAAPATPANPVSPALAATPATPAVPASPAPVVLDVLAKSGGKFEVAVGSNSSDIRPLPFSSTGGALNSLNVTDTAQQNLSAIVNVNAAGSVVPVQVNLTVLMNSTVENLSSYNDLKLSNYTTYVVQ